jgi:hypothetical protein
MHPYKEVFRTGNISEIESSDRRYMLKKYKY